MKVGFIGAGKVGCSLYDYFVHNNIPVTGCYTRTQAKVSGTEKQTQKIFTTSIDKILTKSDVLFLTVPDDAIAAVWELVKTYPIQGKFICHCSGSLGSAVLLELKKPERTVTLFIQCFHLKVKKLHTKIYHRLYSVWKEMKNT